MKYLIATRAAETTPNPSQSPDVASLLQARRQLQEQAQRIEAEYGSPEGLEADNPEHRKLRDQRRQVQEQIEAINQQILARVESKQPGDAEQRLAKIRMAVQLLAQAGLTDDAQRVKQKLESMARELEQSRSRSARTQATDSSSIAELRSQVEQLRRELAELRELVRKSPDK